MDLTFYSYRLGKSTGFVVTSKVTHASPAPLYAVCPSRSWENDAQLPKHARHHSCKDIGAQLVDPIGASMDVRNFIFYRKKRSFMNVHYFVRRCKNELSGIMPTLHSERQRSSGGSTYKSFWHAPPHPDPILIYIFVKTLLRRRLALPNKGGCPLPTTGNPRSIHVVRSNAMSKCIL